MARNPQSCPKTAQLTTVLYASRVQSDPVHLRIGDSETATWHITSLSLNAALELQMLQRIAQNLDGLRGSYFSLKDTRHNNLQLD